MAVYLEGNIWDSLPYVDYLLFTANSVVKKNGELVMGAGIALQVKQRFPELPKLFGDLIKSQGKEFKWFGCIFNSKICAFQTKTDYNLNSDLDLIKYSTEMLRNHALANPDKWYSLAFPGINNGNLDINLVKPITDTLPDNVSVWRFK